jgi:hypothetical protein
MFTMIFGVALLALFLAFWLWHSPVRRKLTSAEIDRYLGAVEKLPFPGEARSETLARLRAWAEADDGRPVFMLNLMRYYPELRPVPGAPEFKGTPEQANAFYERSVMGLLFKRGGYPLVGGSAQGKDLTPAPAALDEWGRVIVVRYPSRRRFLSLLADPAYAPFLPYKLMALELVLVPVSGNLVLPDLRWIVGGLFLFLFMAAAWIRAAW